jgi:anaerobic magnesium-protoporphyrin IX monomethyl ester cyclase
MSVDRFSPTDATPPAGLVDVLLAHSYFLRNDPKQVEKMKPYPPLGTLLAAAALRQRGFRVRLFDAMLSAGVEEFIDLLAETRPSVIAIFEDNFNFLTKMCTVRNRDAAQQMMRAARATGARVVVNGSDAADQPELYLDAGADAVIVGEVEETACELLEAWRRDRDAPLESIPGLVLPGRPASDLGDGSSASKVRRTGARQNIRQLDVLPFPAWDLVNLEGYREAWNHAHGRFSWNMVTSRGCPYACNWCAKPVFGRRYAQRSPASVAQELRQLRDHVKPDHVWFADDIFGLTAAWIEAFAKEVALRAAATPFMMQSRVNLMVPRVVDALRVAGCEEVWLGVESGSQRILDAMDKGTQIDQIRSATRNLKERGIRCCWFIQLGFLDERWEEIVLTRDLIRSERPDDIGVSVAYPLPGTKFFEMVRSELGAKRNWIDSDELAMLFEGTYVTSFYREVRELLHAEVRDVASVDGNGTRLLNNRWRELARAESGLRSEHANAQARPRREEVVRP